MALDDAIFIIGSGHTKFGRLSQTLEQLIISAAQEAIEDAAVNPAEIDALFLGHFNSGMSKDGFASSHIQQAHPALRYKPASRCENACASGSAAIHAAINAILAGKARKVLVVGVEKMTNRSTADVTDALAGAGYQNDPVEASLSFPQVFAIAAETYTSRFQDPMSAMARISSKNHGNAMHNPLAQMHRALTFDECNAVSDRNPLIAPPLRLSDCSLISDGAAAIILSTANAAAGASKRVRIAAAEHVSDYLPMQGRDFVQFSGPGKAIARAYAVAGIDASNLDFAEVHDCFTIAELLSYEAMGLTKAGRGEEALESGLVQRDGKTPVNLSGGLKAKGHPVGATGVSMHALGFRQLTGTAGGIQKDGAEIGLVFNMGGAAVANYATVLVADRA